MASRSAALPDRVTAGPANATFADTLHALCKEALQCHRAGRLADAIARYEQILSLDANLPVICSNLGHALAELGKPDAAVARYRRAVELKPDYPEALCNWGAALANLNRFDEAVAKFRQAIAVNSGFAGAHHNLAVALKESGRLDEARLAAQRAIELGPRNISYYAHLATLRPFAAGDRYFRALESMAPNGAAMSAIDQIHLHFSLAKAYEDTGAFDSAFAHLSAGNRLRRAHIAHDEAAAFAGMDRVRQVFSTDFMRKRQGLGAPSPVPVFIVGMPRSGTTLIEQILASHPEIYGAGEVSIFEQAAEASRNPLAASATYPEAVMDMPAEHFRALGERYLEKLLQLAPHAARITDKMTGNFLYAGLIHLALPNAIIIHAVRDPIDTCVSCFATNFSVAQTYSYDLAELGRYYRHYKALMAHWHCALPPGRIIDVHYEELVDDLEGVARRIVAHCGLAWDARCAEFHRTERMVRTASAFQVRQPIYKSSVGRWRRYERFLRPLLTELECDDTRGADSSLPCNLTMEMHVRDASRGSRSAIIPVDSVRHGTA